MMFDHFNQGGANVITKPKDLCPKNLKNLHF